MNASESAKPKMQPGDKFKPSDQSLQTAVIVPRYTTSMNFPRHTPGQASEAGEDTDPTEAAEPAREAAAGGPRRDYRHSTETTCGYCGQWPHKAGEDCKATGQECSYCGRLGHFSKVCRQRLYHQQSRVTRLQ